MDEGAGRAMAGPDDEEKIKKGGAGGKIAVALDYDLGGKDAPVVVASGRGHVAEQILQIAFARGVKVREDADLAQLLAAVDVDSEIPVEAFAAVAEILVYLYRANRQALPSEGAAP